MSKSRETDLVRLAEEGDSDSFGLLVDLHARAVLAVACSRVPDFGASEDIAQDTFLLAYQKLGTLREPQNFGPWVKAIARNLCLRWHRNRVYRCRLQEDGAALRERLGYPDEAHGLRAIEQQESRALVRKALDFLPIQEREALLLFYFEGRSTAEAARAAGVAEAAMRKRLQRAREHLRDVLTAQVEADLSAVGKESQTSRRVLAALPLGATFARVVARPESVLPTARQLAASRMVAPLAGHGPALVLGSVVVIVAAATGLFMSFGDEKPLLVEPAAIVSPMPEPKESTDAHAAIAVSPAEALAAATTPRPVDQSPRTVAGTVRDAEGLPVTGAKVEALLRTEDHGPQEGVRDVAAAATTDAAGGYELSQLPEAKGEILLLASHVDWATCGFRLDPLKPGEHRKGIDVMLPRPTTVTGKVVDEGGNPLSEATVFLAGVSHPDFYTTHKSVPTAPWIQAGQYGDFARTITDADGCFTLGHIPDKWVIFQLGACKPGYAVNYALSADNAERRRRELLGSGSTGWSACDISLPCGDQTLVLTRGGTLAGQVTSKIAGGSLAGVSVFLEGSVEAPELDSRVTYDTVVRTDTAGAFRFDDVPVCEAQLQARQDGAVSLQRNVRVVRGKTLDGIGLVLARAVSIEGTIFDASTRAPLAGVCLRYIGKDIMGRFADARADARGHFRIDGLPAGDWCIGPAWGWTLDEGYHQDRTPLGAITVSVDEGATLRADFYGRLENPRDSTSPRLQGKVLDLAGRPVAGAEVAARDASGRSWTTLTADEGTFAFARMDAGTVYLTVTHTPSLAYSIAETEVPEDESGTVDVVLDRRAARISGHIVDEKGQPFRKPLQVHVYPFLSERPLYSDKDGAFSLGAVAPGQYSVSAYAWEQGCKVSPKDISVRVEEGESREDVNFVVIPMTGSVAGTVVLEDGAPAAQVRVTARSEGGDSGTLLAEGSTDANGHFDVSPIDGENIAITVKDLSGGGRLAYMEGLSAGAANTRITLRRSGILRGWVVPVPEGGRLAVSAEAASGYRVGNPECSDGTFELKLPADTHNLEITCGNRTRRVEGIVVPPGATVDLGEINMDTDEENSSG